MAFPPAACPAQTLTDTERLRCSDYRSGVKCGLLASPSTCSNPPPGGGATSTPSITSLAPCPNRYPPRTTRTSLLFPCVLPTALPWHPSRGCSRSRPLSLAAPAHAHTRAHTHMCTHACRRTHKSTQTYSYTCALTHAYRHMHKGTHVLTVHTCIQAYVCTHTYRCSHVHTCTRAYIHVLTAHSCIQALGPIYACAQMHALTCAHMHTGTHVHANTDTQYTQCTGVLTCAHTRHSHTCAHMYSHAHTCTLTHGHQAPGAEPEGIVCSLPVPCQTKLSQRTDTVGLECHCWPKLPMHDVLALQMPFVPFPLLLKTFHIFCEIL